MGDGTKTSYGLVCFQNRNNLTVTGMINDETLACMIPLYVQYTKRINDVSSTATNLTDSSAAAAQGTGNSKNAVINTKEGLLAILITNLFPGISTQAKYEFNKAVIQKSDNGTLKALSWVFALPQGLSVNTREVFKNSMGSHYYDNPEMAEATIDMLIGYLSGCAISGADSLIPNGGGNPRIFTSTDPLVGDLATNIEAKFPGRVVDVNRIVRGADGKIITDFDIELDNAIIQVKEGGGKGMVSQLERTANATNKTVIGYGPDLKGSIVKGANAKGFNVFRSEAELLEFLKNFKKG